MKRLNTFIGKILQASYDLMPASAKKAYKGHVCIDATMMPVRGQHTDQRAIFPDDPEARTSPEAMAGLYRDGQTWGYEAHLVVMTGDGTRREQDDDFPYLVTAYALDKPGAPGTNAITCLRSLAERGFPTGILVGDRAYLPSSDEDVLQRPALALGWEFCSDLKVNQMGLQAELNGAILVDGTWYSASMPLHLRNASITHRKAMDKASNMKRGAAKEAAKTEAETTYQKALGLRERFRLIPKEVGRSDGMDRYSCPARGRKPTLACDLCPLPKNDGRRQLPLFPVNGPLDRDGLPVSQPDTICTQASVTMPRGTAKVAKYIQKYPFRSEKWYRHYGHARAVIESYNDFIKNGNKEALEDPDRRRVRGYARQALIVALMVFSANLRKLVAWAIRQASPTSRTKGRRRPLAAENLHNFLPIIVEAVPTEHPPDKRAA